MLGLVRDGVSRPGAMQKRIEGLSAKVLNERLWKLQRFGILEKTIYPEIPPHVEYALTELGRSFAGLLDAVEELQSALDRGASLK